MSCLLKMYSCLVAFLMVLYLLASVLCQVVRNR